MQYRVYNPEKDLNAVVRVFYEVGWMDKVDSDKDNEGLDRFLSSGHTLVTDINGEAECVVSSMPGTIRYLEEDLAFSCVTSVTTSRLARKQGLAKRLTAQLVAADAADGALVSGLGMFEQGYYNQLGYGTGGYEHWVRFDPARLNIDVRARTPRRITKDDWEKVHAARLARKRGHGACNLHPPQYTQGDMESIPNFFGFGYQDSNGEFTHHICFWTKSAEHGPYGVTWLCYQTREQFLELMALVKNLGDQVHLVRMREPQGVQMQDLVTQPLKYRHVTEKSEYASGNQANAYWQLRICDLPGCLAQTHLPGVDVRFNLKLSDPIARYLDADALWHGVAGDYVVTLGPTSSAEPGSDATLPTLTASVNAFTRMWLGIRPATGLAFTEDMDGPEALLKALDWALRLPEPKPDWDF